MAAETTVRFSIEGMSCASCVGRVDRALAALPGVTEVAVNLATESAAVRYTDGTIDPRDILAASTTAGYRATLSAEDAAKDRANRQALDAIDMKRRVVVAAALALPVFLLEMGTHLIPSFHMFIEHTIGRQTSWIIQFALTTVLLFGPGRAFFAKGIPALIKAAPDMNSLVALGTGAAWTYSVVATFVPMLLPDGVRAVYFESAAIIVLLILVGRWLEARAKGRTGTAIQSLLGLQTPTARLLRDGNATGPHPGQPACR